MTASVQATRRRTHLATLSAITGRLAAGSWLLRAWAGLLIGALLAVASHPVYPRWSWLALALAIGFWMLDAFLLRGVRLFRKERTRVEGLPESELELSLDTSAVDTPADAWSNVLFDVRLLLFHGAVIAAILVVRLLPLAR
jgi:hypothetical protein